MANRDCQQQEPRAEDSKHSTHVPCTEGLGRELPKQNRQ